MWNSFQGALEKRVRNGEKNKVVADKYILTKVTQKVLFEMFGLAGRENIQILVNEQRKITLKCQKSIWRSELTLNLESLRKRVEMEIGPDSYQGLFVN